MYEAFELYHGRNLHEASSLYGIHVNDLLDFGANINPLGLPEIFREIILSNINNLINYPDTSCKDLRNKISSYLNVSNDLIVIGNGAIEVI